LFVDFFSIYLIVAQRTNILYLLFSGFVEMSR